MCETELQHPMELPDIYTSGFDKQALLHSCVEGIKQNSVRKNSQLSDVGMEPNSWLDRLLVQAWVPEFLC